MRLEEEVVGISRKLDDKDAKEERFRIRKTIYICISCGMTSSRRSSSGSPRLKAERLRLVNNETQ